MGHTKIEWGTYKNYFLVVCTPLDHVSLVTMPSSARCYQGVTPLTTTTRLGGVTTLQDNNKTKIIENISIKLNDQNKRKQLPSFNLNQMSITKL
jgi:hypothetical protein